MQEQILNLLHQTQSPDDSLIRQAEQELTNLAASSEFLPSLNAILINSNIPEISRLSALIHMRIVIEHFWMTSISPETKNIIKSSLPELIINWPIHRRQNVHHYAHTMIKASFLIGEWPELPTTILSLLSQPNEMACRAGLTLASSLCGSAKVIDNKNIQICPVFVEFGVTLLNVLGTLFSQCEVHEFLALGFHCAARLLMSNVGINFEPLADIFVTLVEKSFLVVNVVESQDYLNYANNALKFSIQFVMKYSAVIPADVIGRYVEAIQQLLPLNVPPKMKCLLLRLLYELFKCPNTWPLFVQNLLNFLMQLMLPLFALTPENISSFQSNPSEFVSDVHKFDNNFEDIRLSASSVIYSLHDHCELVDAARIVAAGAYINYGNLPNRSLNDQIILFSAFHMFSSVSKFMNDLDPLLFTKFFLTIFPLFDSEEDLGRSAAFMLLSESTNVNAPPEFIMKCIEHLVDPCPLARYYAVISAAGLLSHLKDADFVRQHFANSPAILAIFTSLFELSQRFQFSDIANAISGLIKIFNVQLLPIAGNVGFSLLQFLANSADSIETAHGIICDSFEFLVDLIATNAETRNQLAPQICTEVFNVLQNIENSDVFDLLASTTIRLLNMAPFTPAMWNASNLLIDRIRKDPKVSITDLTAIISILVFKDEDFAARENMMFVIAFVLEQLNQKMSEFDSWNEFAKLAASILLRLTGANSAAQSIVSPLSQMVVIQIEADHSIYSPITGLVTLINALLMTDMALVSQALGGKMGVLLEFWIESAIFPETVQTFIRCYDNLCQNNDVFMRVFLNISESVLGDVMMRDEDDLFDEEADNDSPCIWFGFSDTLMKLYNLYNHINQSNPSLYQKMLQQLPPEWQEKIPEMPNVAALYLQNKK